MNKFIPLFIIKKLNAEQYWSCSTEHGTGWNPNEPKQAFSKSELVHEIHRLAYEGYFTNIAVIQLKI